MKTTAKWIGTMLTGLTLFTAYGANAMTIAQQPKVQKSHPETKPAQAKPAEVKPAAKTTAAKTPTTATPAKGEHKEGKGQTVKK